MSLDQVVALHIERKSIFLSDVLRFSNMQDSLDGIDHYITKVLIVAYAEEHQITISQEEIQAAVVV